ncbi:MAG: hypothetical protein IPK58_20110 [Acidobacteria bacterium]|nr:hypothetical protein [Acidobacteriota bacterium]
MFKTIKQSIGSGLVILAALAVISSAMNAVGQELPDEIRGYKVEKANIIISNRTDAVESNKSEARVRVGDPELTDKSLSGITFEVNAELDSLRNSGTVDFLAFHQFKVNGIDVSIDDYNNSFEFKKKQTLFLPKPIKVFVGTFQTLRGALGEIRDSKPEWEVTGTVFVFGKFKKWGMKFKRVVPVEVRLTIKNPIRDQKILSEVTSVFSIAGN